MQYIFLHGLGQTEKSWDSVLSGFTKSNVQCPNLQSLLNSQDATYVNLYQGFQEYCGGFSEPLHLCGLSLGGILALNYAIDFPDRVRSLVLIGTQYQMPKRLLKLQNAIFHFLPQSAFDSMGFTKRDFMSLTNSMAELDFNDGLPSIVCNSLLVCGAQDHANKKAAIELSQKIRGARFVSIEHAKHEVNLENGACLLQELERFYAEIG